MLGVRNGFWRVVVSVLIVGCGGDDFEAEQKPPPPPCNEDPWTCPAGQTCWPVGAGEGFKCLNAGPGAEGAACQLFQGSPTCGSGLFCSVGDVCKRFCNNEDVEKGCSGGDICAPLKIMDVVGSIQVCGPP